jgi:hypothetical protein
MAVGMGIGISIGIRIGIGILVEWKYCAFDRERNVSLVQRCVSFQIPKSHIFCMSTSALAPTPTVNPPSLLQFRENCKTARTGPYLRRDRCATLAQSNTKYFGFKKRTIGCKIFRLRTVNQSPWNATEERP